MVANGHKWCGHSFRNKCGSFSVLLTSPRSIRQRLCLICQGFEFVTNDRCICYEFVSVLHTWSSPIMLPHCSFVIVSIS